MPAPWEYAMTKHGPATVVAAAMIFAALFACKSGGISKEEELQRKEQELKEREAKLKEQQGAANQPAAQAPAAEPVSQPAQPTAPQPAAPSGPRDVTVSVSVAVDITKPGGAPWDVAGDAADPLISAQSSSGQSGSASFKDQQNVTATFKMKLSSGDSVTVTAVDKDVAANDPIGTFSAKYSGPGSTGKGRNGAGSFTITFK